MAMLITLTAMSASVDVLFIIAMVTDRSIRQLTNMRLTIMLSIYDLFTNISTLIQLCISKRILFNGLIALSSRLSFATVFALSLDLYLVVHYTYFHRRYVTFAKLAAIVPTVAITKIGVSLILIQQGYIRYS